MLQYLGRDLRDSTRSKFFLCQESCLSHGKTLYYCGSQADRGQRIKVMESALIVLRLQFQDDDLIRPRNGPDEVIYNFQILKHLDSSILKTFKLVLSALKSTAHSSDNININAIRNIHD